MESMYLYDSKRRFGAVVGSYAFFFYSATVFFLRIKVLDK